MDGGSPSRHKEKRSKKNQDRAAVPRPSSCTKVAYQRGGVGGSRAARRRDDHGPLAAAPPPAPAPVGDVSMVDEEEEALDRARCTIAAPPTRTPTRRPGFVSRLVPFTGVSPIMRDPTLAPNPAGGWTPLLPVDYRHWVKDIRS